MEATGRQNIIELSKAYGIEEDKLEDLDSDTLYFMTTILNQLDLDEMRNDILLKVLPLKI